jgi:hypothetical protein
MKYAKYFFRPIVLKMIFYGFIVTQSGCLAQDNSEKAEENFRRHHQLGLVLSHSHVFEGRDDEGKRETLSLPAWGVDYTYAFHPKWGVGVHTDIVIEKFKVEKNLGNKEVIERSYPVAPAIMGIYKPVSRWSFLLGMGAEFAKEENFALMRAGVESGTELPKGWEIFGTFGYDFRWNAYDQWTFGVGLTKAFGE